MKYPLRYAALLTILIVAISIFIGAPSQKWAEIEIGMSDNEIIAKLGVPNSKLLDSKGIQIWVNDGFIHASSLAVLYYDPQNKDLATKTIRSHRWIWERL